ncbi:MAG: DoxX family protein [Burkholderiales bacterium]|nr:DoxX family protein [Burkholderiales bacterium]
MNTNRDVAALVARILLSAMFIYAGFGKITGFDGLVGYIASKGIPLPQLMAIGAILVELGGGLLLLVGFKARWAALAFFLFLIPVTVIFHDFWTAPPEQVMAQQTNFLKNVTIMGGMLMVWAFGPGRLALDRDGA